MTTLCHPLSLSPRAPAQAFLSPLAWVQGCGRNRGNPSPLSISSCVPGSSVGRTTSPEAWSSAPHRQSGTTRWNNQGCHSQSSLHRRPGDKGNRWVRWDPQAYPTHQRDGHCQRSLRASHTQDFCMPRGRERVICRKGSYRGGRKTSWRGK